MEARRPLESPRGVGSVSSVQSDGKTIAHGAGSVNRELLPMGRNGRNAKSPAFQFYATDFLADPKVLAMSTQEVGAYILLLCAEWIDGPLRNEPAFLARIARLTPAEFECAWPAIGRCFELHGGTLSNPRLERERQFQAASRSRMKELSRKGVEGRFGDRTVHRTVADGAPHGEPYGNPPTPDTRYPIPDTRMREREDPPIPIPDEREDGPQGSRLLAALRMHPRLAVPAVHEALRRWEAHRGERGAGEYTTAAAEAALCEWERHGPEWVVRAVGVWIQANAKNWFPVDESRMETPAADPSAPGAYGRMLEEGRARREAQKRKGAGA